MYVSYVLRRLVVQFAIINRPGGFENRTPMELLCIVTAMEVAIHPLTLVTTNLQAGKYKGTKECVMGIYEKEGLYGFYKGWTATVLLTAARFGLEFGAAWLDSTL